MVLLRGRGELLRVDVSVCLVAGGDGGLFTVVEVLLKLMLCWLRKTLVGTNEPKLRARVSGDLVLGMLRGGTIGELLFWGVEGLPAFIDASGMVRPIISEAELCAEDSTVGKICLR